jgi:nitrite reductase (NADH) large subunit
MKMKIVIIGAGPAGVSVAETVRANDSEPELVVISAEPHPPYSPPAMVDHFLSGSGAHLWRGLDWPERLGVDYRNGTKVTAIDPKARLVELDDGTSLGYDRLVIASGSRLYAGLEGADLPGVYNFKSLSAAEALVSKVKAGEARHAVVVGAGFIGMEVALLLRNLGLDVTQVEMLDQVMPAMLDKDTAAYALDRMRVKGVNVLLETKARTFLGDGSVRGVELESGKVLEADVFIAATGVRPNLEFLAGSGITYDWGISVDDHLRTNLPEVFAAGDVVEAPDRLTGEVFVHAIFPNAVEQGRLVGFNLLGYDTVYQGAHRMNSLKHLGLSIMAAGLKEGDQVLKTQSDKGLRKIYLKENRIVGFQFTRDVQAVGVFRSMMNRGYDVSKIKDRLLDLTFGQGTLAWGAIQAG